MITTLQINKKKKVRFDNTIYDKPIKFYTNINKNTSFNVNINKNKIANANNKIIFSKLDLKTGKITSILKQPNKTPIINKQVNIGQIINIKPIIIKKINCPDYEIPIYNGYINTSSEYLTRCIINHMSKIYNDSQRLCITKQNKQIFDLKYYIYNNKSIPNNIFTLLINKLCNVIFEKLESSLFEIYTIYNEFSNNYQLTTENCFELTKYSHTMNNMPMTVHYALLSKSLIPIFPYSIYFYHPITVGIPNINIYVILFRFRLKQMPTFKVVNEIQNFFH
jgi:hypothetical protein